MTKTKAAVVTVVAVIGWYAFIIFLPATGHPRLALPVLVQINMRQLAGAGLGADGVQKEVDRYRWKDRFNSYTVHLEPGSQDLWTLTAQPAKKSVGYPLWKQALFLDFYRFEYPTIRIKAGDNKPEIMR